MPPRSKSNKHVVSRPKTSQKTICHQQGLLRLRKNKIVSLRRENQELGRYAAEKEREYEKSKIEMQAIIESQKKEIERLLEDLQLRSGQIRVYQDAHQVQKEEIEELQEENQRYKRKESERIAKCERERAKRRKRRLDEEKQELEVANLKSKIEDLERKRMPPEIKAIFSGYLQILSRNHEEYKSTISSKLWKLLKINPTSEDIKSAITEFSGPSYQLYLNAVAFNVRQICENPQITSEVLETVNEWPSQDFMAKLKKWCLEYNLE